MVHNPLPAANPIGRSRPETDILNADISESPERTRSQFNAVAVSTNRTVTDHDIFAPTVRIMTLEADRIVIRIELAILDQHIFRIDVDSVVIEIAMVADRHAA